MAKGIVIVNEEMCKECGYCTLFCPKKLMQIGEHLNSQSHHPAVFIDPQGKCTGCGICFTVCPDLAIKEVWRSKNGK